MKMLKKEMKGCLVGGVVCSRKCSKIWQQLLVSQSDEVGISTRPMGPKITRGRQKECS